MLIEAGQICLFIYLFFYWLHLITLEIKRRWRNTKVNISSLSPLPIAETFLKNFQLHLSTQFLAVSKVITVVVSIDAIICFTTSTTVYKTNIHFNYTYMLTFFHKKMNHLTEMTRSLEQRRHEAFSVLTHCPITRMTCILSSSVFNRTR